MLISMIVIINGTDVPSVKMKLGLKIVVCNYLCVFYRDFYHSNVNTSADPDLRRPEPLANGP